MKASFLAPTLPSSFSLFHSSCGEMLSGIAWFFATNESVDSGKCFTAHAEKAEWHGLAFHNKWFCWFRKILLCTVMAHRLLCTSNGSRITWYDKMAHRLHNTENGAQITLHSKWIMDYMIRKKLCTSNGSLITWYGKMAHRLHTCGMMSIRSGRIFLKVSKNWTLCLEK